VNAASSEYFSLFGRGAIFLQAVSDPLLSVTPTVVCREPAVGRLIKPHPSGKETSASPELRIRVVDASGFKVPYLGSRGAGGRQAFACWTTPRASMR
jgi:hypothetical protein